MVMNQDDTQPTVTTHPAGGIMKKCDIYTYDFKVGTKTVHCGITNDLDSKRN